MSTFGNVVDYQQGLNEVVIQKIDNLVKKNSGGVNSTIVRLISENKIARDFIAPIGVNLKVQGSRPIVTFESNGHVSMVVRKNEEHESFTLHDNAIRQLAEKFGVPTRYLADLANGDDWQKNLAKTIMNDHSGWTERSRVLVRSVGTEVRGVLSDHYRRLNSMEILTSFFSEVQRNNAVLVDGFMSDTKMWFEAIYPEPMIINTIKNGVIAIAFGARISSSDYGDGALDMRSFFMVGSCLNGAVRNSVMRQIHLGGKLPDNIALSQRTYELDTRTQASAVKDLTKSLFSKETIHRNAFEIQEASNMEVDISKELKNLGKGKMLKEEVEEVGRILTNSKQEDGVTGESTLWKLVNGITAHARTVDPRRTRELHEIAGELMNRVEVPKKNTIFAQ